MKTALNVRLTILALIAHAFTLAQGSINLEVGFFEGEGIQRNAYTLTAGYTHDLGKVQLNGSYLRIDSKHGGTLSAHYELFEDKTTLPTIGAGIIYVNEIQPMINIANEFKLRKELSLKLGLTLSEDYSIALLGLKLKI